MTLVLNCTQSSLWMTVSDSRSRFLGSFQWKTNGSSVSEDPFHTKAQPPKKHNYCVALGLLAISSLAFFKTSKFQTCLRFSCENLAFLFFNKRAWLEIESGPQRKTIHKYSVWVHLRSDFLIECVVVLATSFCVWIFTFFCSQGLRICRKNLNPLQANWIDMQSFLVIWYTLDRPTRQQLPIWSNSWICNLWKSP